MGFISSDYTIPISNENKCYWKILVYLWLIVPKDNAKKSKKEKSRTAPSSLFQRKQVDLLLEELIKKYPPQRVKVCLVQDTFKEPVLFGIVTPDLGPYNIVFKQPATTYNLLYVE